MITKQTAKELTDEELRTCLNEYYNRWRSKNREHYNKYKRKYMKDYRNAKSNKVVTKSNKSVTKSNINVDKSNKVKPLKLIEKEIPKDKQVGDIFK